MGGNTSDFIGSVFNPNDYLKKSDAYKPKVLVGSIYIGVQPLATTFQQKFHGTFLDYIKNENITLTASNQTGVSVTVISKTYDELVLEITTNAVVQLYTLNITSGTDVFTSTFTTDVFTLIVPNNGVNTPALWVKPAIANNDVVLGLGSFSAEQNNGEGWNEQAYFGPLNSASKIIFSFDVLNNVNTYCVFKFGTDTTKSTGSADRLYISNGSTLTAYGNNGQSIGNTSVSVGDSFKLELTPTQAQIFKNGDLVLQTSGTYSLSNMYLNMVAYRFMRLENINAKVY